MSRSTWSPSRPRAVVQVSRLRISLSTKVYSKSLLHLKLWRAASISSTSSPRSCQVYVSSSSKSAPDQAKGPLTAVGSFAIMSLGIAAAASRIFMGPVVLGGIMISC